MPGALLDTECLWLLPHYNNPANKETDLKEIAKVPFWRYVQCLAYWMAIGRPNRDIKWSEIYESS